MYIVGISTLEILLGFPSRPFLCACLCVCAKMSPSHSAVSKRGRAKLGVIDSTLKDIGSVGEMKAFTEKYMLLFWGVKEVKVTGTK